MDFGSRWERHGIRLALGGTTKNSEFRTGLMARAFGGAAGIGLGRKQVGEEDVGVKDGVPRRRGTRSRSGGDVVVQLATFFHRNGYVRRQVARRLKEGGSQRYKKGDEVRLVANTPEELTLIRRLLHEAGFRPGRPFAKGSQHRQPIYGRGEVRRFLALVGERK